MRYTRARTRVRGAQYCIKHISFIDGQCIQLTREMFDSSSDKTGALAGAIVGVLVALATLLALLVARRATETHAETDATVPEANESESELETEPQMVTTTVLPTSRVLFRGPMLHCHNMVMQTETGSYVMETRVYRIRNGVVVGPGSQS